MANEETKVEEKAIAEEAAIDAEALEARNKEAEASDAPADAPADGPAEEPADEAETADEEGAEAEAGEAPADAPFGPVQTVRSKAADQISEETRNLLRRKRPRRYVDDGSEVFTQSAKTKYESEIRQVDPAMQRLIHAKQTTSYLTTRVSGTRNDRELGLCAICYYGDEEAGEKIYQVLIPWERFTDTTEEDLIRRKITKSIFIERRIGSVIDFVPEDYRNDGDTFVFIGNRLQAMTISCYENWFAIDRDSRNEDLKFNVGSRIEARIVGKFPNAGLRVEIFGVESTIPISALSWIRIPPNLSSIKEDVGDNIVVCITKLRRQRNPMKVSYEASVKKTRPDPRLAAFDRIEVGDSLHGKISNITFNADDITKSRIFIALDGGGEALCARYGPEEVRIGDKVSVRIGNKYMTDEGEPRLEAMIKHIYHL